MRASHHPPFRIGRSRTGLGLFATAPIRRGTFVIEYIGERISNAEADRRRRSRYLFELNSRWTIDGATRTNIARYINHACRPNAKAFITRGHIRIRAVRNIRVGEEIAYHYGKGHFEAFIKPKGCRCTACAAR